MALPAVAAALLKAATAKKKADLIKKVAIPVAGLLFGSCAVLSVAIDAAVTRGDAARAAALAAQVSLGAIAPAGLRAAAVAAEAKTGIPASVLLAIASTESSYGTHGASLSDAEAAALAQFIPPDILPLVHQADLVAGGPIPTMIGFPARTIRLGDWVNSTPGAQHAMGFMQFMPTTWTGKGIQGEAAQALGHVPDPYNPADALMMAGFKLHDDSVGVGRTLSAALDAYGGGGYATTILALAEQTMVAAGKPDTCAHPVLTQGYGPVSFGVEPPLRGALHYHTGADLSCGLGTPIASVTDGVAHVYPDPHPGAKVGWGNVVVVETGGFHVRYCHLSGFVVADGAVVHAGDIIGKEGSTGASTGSHLHFEIDSGPASASDYQNSTSPFVLLDTAGYTVQAGAEGATH